MYKGLGRSKESEAVRAGLILDANAPLVRHLESLAARNLRPGTIDARFNCVRRLASHIHPVPVLEATHDLILGFLSRPQAAESRATELSHLRGFFRWCFLEDILPNDPTVKLTRPRLPKRRPRPIPSDLLREALRHAPTHRVRPWLLLACYAGLRACEIAQLTSPDLLWSDHPPMILINESKGGHQQAVPFGAELRLQLQDCQLPTSGWLFPRLDGHEGHVAPWIVSGGANRYLHDMGITHTLHSLRHWYGTHAYQASGRDLRQTQELMRHATPSSTALYTFVDPGEGARIIDRLPAL